LFVSLVVAGASAKHVKTARRNHEGQGPRTTCYDRNHPVFKCSPENSENYPTILQLTSGLNETRTKQFLKGSNTLENLCSEVSELLDCVTSTIESASAECQREFASQDLTIDYVRKGSSFVRLLCTRSNIQKLRRNLDCLVSWALVNNASECARANPNHDCSQFYSNFDRSIDYDAANACYEEKYRRNCDADEVVTCAGEVVGNECGEEARQLIEFAGNALYERVPICPEERKFKALLKFFK